MATITSPKLVITGVNPTTVELKVTYTLIPTSNEKLAGAVFSENIQLIGDDPGVTGDTVIATFTSDAFAVSTATPLTGLVRTRKRNILKSILNEDPGFEATGAEQVDEVFARITLTYVTPITPPTLPPPTPTNVVKGAWK